MNKFLTTSLSAVMVVSSLGFAPAARAQSVQETRSMPGDPQYEKDRRSELRENRGPERRFDSRNDGRADGRADGRYDPRPSGGYDPRRDPRYDGRRDGRVDGRYDGRVDGRHDGRYDGRHDGLYEGRYQQQRREELRNYERWQRAQNHYDAGEYRRPRGYVDRQWVYGQTLPPSYRSRAYVVSDYPSYGLRQPPYGYQYTRVGNDVLLTAVATGVIAAVIVGLFN